MKNYSSEEASSFKPRCYKQAMIMQKAADYPKLARSRSCDSSALRPTALPVGLRPPSRPAGTRARSSQRRRGSGRQGSRARLREESSARLWAQPLRRQPRGNSVSEEERLKIHQIVENLR